MTEKTKIAVYWSASCGGCDVSLLDTEEKLLTLAEHADIVYWPVALDFKWSSVEARPAGSIDIGLWNGAIRTSEQREQALVFRAKCKLLLAYGSCACFGGIPGLANLYPAEEILHTAYSDTASTDNPEGVKPQSKFTANGMELTLPAFLPEVFSLGQVVPVDAFLPGCPPPLDQISKLLDYVASYANNGSLPPAGAVLAADKALCDTCRRNASRPKGRIEQIFRPHQLNADPEQCFLAQGLLCLGLATRGGCGETCIRANMPCRGCFGPTSTQFDPGADALSAIGSITGASNENDVPAHEMKKAIRSIVDPVGTFYRFTLSTAFLPHAVTDEKPKE